MRIIKEKISLYWKLIKSLQTGLLLATGLAGFMSCKCPIFNIPILLGISASLFLSISGSTVLNMWFDRDIDAKMKRYGDIVRENPGISWSPRQRMFNDMEMFLD